jgi:hypothetical protein
MILAWLAGGAVILSAAYIGDIRAAIQSAFPEHYAVIIGGLVLAAAAVAVAAAAVRIRERRGRGFGVMALALGGAVGWIALFRTGVTDVDVVEAFHFVEYGVLAALFYRAWRFHIDGRRLLYPVLAGTVVATGDEFLQWYIPSRVGEMHDIALDVAAVVLGLLFATGVEPPPRSALRVRGALRPVAAAVVGVLMLLGLFVAVVHTGYEITDPEIGTFRSQYPAGELRRLAAERAPQWQLGLSEYSGRFAREDHYRSEALWHVQERNEAMEIGDALTAWRENLILEKFYTPLLESPPLAPRFRWTAEQRALIADAAARASDKRYVSRAQPLPIYTY